MINKYAGSCGKCGNRVHAKAGQVVKSPSGVWQAFHLACMAGGAIIEVQLSSGHSFTRNAKGTCEDAPCCGCCTF